MLRQQTSQRDTHVPLPHRHLGPSHLYRNTSLSPGQPCGRCHTGTALHCAASCSAVLCYTVVYYTVLCCTALHYTALQLQHTQTLCLTLGVKSFSHLLRVISFDQQCYPNQQPVLPLFSIIHYWSVIAPEIQRLNSLYLYYLLIYSTLLYSILLYTTLLYPTSTECDVCVWGVYWGRSRGLSSLGSFEWVLVLYQQLIAPSPPRRSMQQRGYCR
jgi:hypothetical protein